MQAFIKALAVSGEQKMVRVYGKNVELKLLTV